MTLSEYMNVENFPLTTQKGLSAKSQFLIDAFNLDQLREHAKSESLSLSQQTLLNELEAKASARAILITDISNSKE